MRGIYLCTQNEMNADFILKYSCDILTNTLSHSNRRRKNLCVKHRFEHSKRHNKRKSENENEREQNTNKHRDH